MSSRKASRRNTLRPKRSDGPKDHTELEKCPACDVRLPKDDLRAQVAHMDRYHPDVIAERLRARP